VVFLGLHPFCLFTFRRVSIICLVMRARRAASLIISIKYVSLNGSMQAISMWTLSSCLKLRVGRFMLFVSCHSPGMVATVSHVANLCLMIDNAACDAGQSVARTWKVGCIGG
jgi:hypothetical protein